MMDPVGECKLGCVFGFRPNLKPVPPAIPTPPPARVPQPICGVFPTADKTQDMPYSHSGCKVGASLNFSNVFSDHAVLQMAPNKAAVYGYIGNASSGQAKVTVAVAGSGAAEDSYSVDATVDSAKGTNVLL